MLLRCRCSTWVMINIRNCQFICARESGPTESKLFLFLSISTARDHLVVPFPVSCQRNGSQRPLAAPHDPHGTSPEMTNRASQCTTTAVSVPQVASVQDNLVSISRKTMFQPLFHQAQLDADGSCRWGRPFLRPPFLRRNKTASHFDYSTGCASRSMPSSHKFCEVPNCIRI